MAVSHLLGQYKICKDILWAQLLKQFPMALGWAQGSFFQYFHICSIRCEGNHDLDVGLVIMETGGKPVVTWLLNQQWDHDFTQTLIIFL